MNGWVNESFIAIYLPSRRRTYVQVLASKVECGSRSYYVIGLGAKDEEFVTFEVNLKRIS